MGFLGDTFVFEDLLIQNSQFLQISQTRARTNHMTENWPTTAKRYTNTTTRSRWGGVIEQAATATHPLSRAQSRRQTGKSIQQKQ